MNARDLIYRAIYKLKQVVLRPRDPYVFEEANPLMAYRCYAGEVELLEPVDKSADTLLSSNVLQASGFVEIAGNVFDLRRDGLYRFYQLTTLSEQRIVCSGGTDSILQTIGYLFGYGNDDDKSSGKNLYTALAQRRVVGSCGTLARVAQQILSRIHISSRVVVLMTTDQWGGQNDGHTLLEISDSDKKWFLYDPSFGICFRKDGHRLSLVDFSKLRNESLEIERLPANLGYSRFNSRGYDYDFWIAERFISSARLLDWYRRIGGIPLVCDMERLFCPHSSVLQRDQQRVASRYEILSDTDFQKMFYL